MKNQSLGFESLQYSVPSQTDNENTTYVMHIIIILHCSILLQRSNLNARALYVHGHYFVLLHLFIAFGCKCIFFTFALLLCYSILQCTQCMSFVHIHVRKIIWIICYIIHHSIICLIPIYISIGHLCNITWG